MDNGRIEVDIMCGTNSGVLYEEITEATEKLENNESIRQFDIVLEIVKIHTDLSVGDQL